MRLGWTSAAQEGIVGYDDAMQYRLRTLMIALIAGPPLIAFLWFAATWARHSLPQLLSGWLQQLSHWSRPRDGRLCQDHPRFRGSLARYRGDLLARPLASVIQYGRSGCGGKRPAEPVASRRTARYRRTVVWTSITCHWSFVICHLRPSLVTNDKWQVTCPRLP